MMMLRSCVVLALLAVQVLPAMHGWKLVWRDEFKGSRLDPGKWAHVIGGNGFGNSELQYYTDRPQNVRVDQGRLIIEAIQENYTGADGVARDLTSGRVHTQGKFS